MSGEAAASAFRGLLPAELAFVSLGANAGKQQTIASRMDGVEVLPRVENRASTGNASTIVFGSMAVGLAGALWRGGHSLTRKSCRPRSSVALEASTAAFTGSLRCPERVQVACKAGNHTMAAAQEGHMYEKPGNQELEFINDVGYLPDGSSLKTAGNNFFRPQSVDPHADGSPLPKSYYVNDVGYLPDGSSLKTAGNNFFRPGSVDPHMDGSPLTPPLKGFCNSIGYLPDGTALELAGNLRLKVPPPVAGAVAPPMQAVSQATDERLAFQHATRDYFALDLLTSKGPRKNPDVGSPADATRPLGKVGTVSAGSWSCTDGGWDSPAFRTTSEVFYVWSGSGCVTDVDGTKHPFGPGDTVVLPKNWSGRWDVYSTIHKVWYVQDHPDFDQPAPIRAVVAPRTAYDSAQSVYKAANMSVGSWSRPTGSFQEVKQNTEWLHVLEGVFFMTNSDGSAKRCVAGDTVLTPKGWRGMLDVLEPVKAMCVDVAS